MPKMKTYQEFEIHDLRDEYRVFTTKVLATPGGVASGETLQEARCNAIDAIENCLEAHRTAGTLFPSHRN